MSDPKNIKKAALILFLAAGPCYAQQVDIKLFKTGAYGVAWSADGTRIAYDTRRSDTKERFFEIHTSDPDGKNDACVSCKNTSLPQKHNGSPYFHPSGKYIIFVSEKPQHDRSSVDAIPGFGAFTDIWLITTDGSKAWKLTDLPNDYDHGIIAPRFSSDGKKVIWVERKTRPKVKKGGILGLWVIKTADFIDGEIPQLSNIKTFEPGGEGFYETYGFSSDGKQIVFCSNFPKRPWYNCQLYTMDAETGANLKQITSIDYNEHAVWFPDGKHIIWMTNTMATRTGTDWWIMEPSGKMKQRLTYFNEPAFNPIYKSKVWAGLGCFSPDGKQYIGTIQTSLLDPKGDAYLLTFSDVGKGSRLKGEYFSNEKFEGTPKTRNDATMNFWWGPPWPDTLVTSDYSVRWSAKLEPRFTEEYILSVPDEKNISAWIDGKIVIDDNSKARDGEKQIAISFVAGKKYDLKVEYHNKINKRGKIYLAWTSKSQYKQVIPVSCFSND